MDYYGDTIETAISAKIGTYISGTVDIADDVDVFAFTLEAGKSYRFEVNGVSSSFPENVQLLDETGQFITGRQVRGEVLFVPESTGTYYLAVTNRSSTSYSIESSVYVYDVGDTIETADSIEVGETISSAVDFYDDADYFAVELVEGTEYTITSDNQASFNEGNLVLDGEGNVIGSSFYGVSLITASYSGTHYIQIDGGINTGDYTLTVDLYNDVGGTVETAGQISVGDALTGRHEIVDDVDMYAITLEAGVDYRFGIRDGDSDIGSTFGIFDADGNSVVEEGRDSDLITFAPETGGVYYLSVGTYRNRIGDYDLFAKISGDIATTNGNDAVAAGDGDNAVRGLLGNDIIFGEAGNDRLWGGDGDDALFGGDGLDLLRGEAGHDTLDGGDGADTLIGQQGDDTLRGGEGDDFLNGGSGDNWIRGENGNDRLFGGDGVDRMAGGFGSDILRAGGGDDILSGGNGSDAIFGGAGDDTIDGDGFTFFGALSGNDTLIGNQGNDTIDGGNGEDVIYGNEDEDVLSGGNGNDFIFGGTENDLINGDHGNDRLFGEDGDDVLFGDDGNDLIRGGDGNDVLDGDVGFDYLIGQNGDDIINGGNQLDFLLGGLGNDTLNGDAGNDRLFGEEGNDTLNGGLGNDILRGGAGNDTLTGGDGFDAIVFQEAFGTDTITDFEDGIDVIIFSGVSGISSLADLTLSQVGNDVLITYGDGSNTVTVQNMLLADLTGADFGIA